VIGAGVESTDGYTGTLPMTVAELLGIPGLTFARKASVEDQEILVERQTDQGFDQIASAPPVLVTVTAASDEPRYPTLKGIMAAKRKPLETWSLADLGISADELHGAALTRVVEVRPPEPKAPTERIEGIPPEEAASRIADWLATRKLI